MSFPRFIRKLHRYLALIIGIQLLFWTLSGLYFSLFPINEIRGADRIHPAEALTAKDLKGVRAPAAAWNVLQEELGAENLTAIRLQRFTGQPFYRIEWQSGGTRQRRQVEARSLEILPPVDETRAVALAQARYRGDEAVASVTRVTVVDEDSEYRGGPLPAWKVRFEAGDGATLWLDAQTGELSAVRVDRWRLFDFLWMLHILDFDAREDFNHGLLQTLAGLALITTLTGFGLWFTSSRTVRRWRSQLSQDA